MTQVRSNWVDKVEKLVTANREIVYARHLQLYRADMDGREFSQALLEAVEHSEARYQILKTLKDIRKKMEILKF